MLRSFLSRFVLCSALFVLPFGAQPAIALSLLDPFNVQATLDAGVAKLGDDVAYGAGDRFKLDIYAPQNPEGLAPVIVFLYGGAWKQGSKADYPFVGHAFAARGFVTVVPDYRLVPDVQYPAFLDDNATAIKWVEDNIERFGGDKTRVFLAGHSAGAYNAVMLGMDRAYLRDAKVTIPIRGLVGLSGPYAVYPFEFKELEDAFGHVDNPQLTQPINLPTDEAVPMFLATGSADLIVSQENTLRMQEKMLADNRSITAKVYDGLGHMEPVMALSSVWRWRSTLLDDIVAFLEEQGAFNPDAFAPIDLTDTNEAGLKAIDALSGDS